MGDYDQFGNALKAMESMVIAAFVIAVGSMVVSVGLLIWIIVH